MPQKIHFPNWQEVVIYPEMGAAPQVLVETDSYKAVIAGLAAGSKLPPHSEGPAIFHILEGAGKMVVGEQVMDISAGSTVVVPPGAQRGIEAHSKLAFLAVRLPHSNI